jgi:hypothetical protein
MRKGLILFGAVLILTVGVLSGYAIGQRDGSRTLPTGPVRQEAATAFNYEKERYFVGPFALEVHARAVLLRYGVIEVFGENGAPVGANYPGNPFPADSTQIQPPYTVEIRDADEEGHHLLKLITLGRERWFEERRKRMEARARPKGEEK